MTKEELKRKMDAGEDFVLVDARSREAYEEEHIPGAISVPAGTFGTELAKHDVDNTKEMIVYCSSTDCDASTQVANQLIKLGFGDVKDYKAGMKDWKEAGFPVQVNAVCSCV